VGYAADQPPDGLKLLGFAQMLLGLFLLRDIAGADD
jgi:hypothetical protein